MTLVAPALEPEAPAEATFEQLLELRRDLHRVKVKLLKRNPPHRRGVDINDARDVEWLDEQWARVPEDVRDEVELAFRREHRCPGLLECPWWPR